MSGAEGMDQGFLAQYGATWATSRSVETDARDSLA
jgi:hypothetical protein